VIKNNQSLFLDVALTELETLVAQMEKGYSNLKQSLVTSVNDIKLTQQRQQALQDAEQKVNIHIQKEGKENAQPFHGEKNGSIQE